MDNSVFSDLNGLKKILDSENISEKIPMDKPIIISLSHVVETIQRKILKTAGIDDETARKIIEKSNDEQGYKRYWELTDEIEITTYGGYPVLKVVFSENTGLTQFN